MSFDELDTTPWSNAFYMPSMTWLLCRCFFHSVVSSVCFFILCVSRLTHKINEESVFIAEESGGTMMMM